MILSYVYKLVHKETGEFYFGYRQQMSIELQNLREEAGSELVLMDRLS